MFLPEARRILRLSDRAALDARRGARGEVGSLRIGFTAASGYDLLPQLLSAARTRLPDVELLLREMVTVDQFEALATDQIDVGLLRPPVDHRKFVSACVLREPLLVALPREHPLANSDRLIPQKLTGQPFVMYSPYEAHYFFQLVTTIFHRAGVTPDYVQHVTQIHSILALVRAGLGAAFVPEAAAKLSPESVSFRPLDIHPKPQAELCLAWLLENDNPILPAFLAATGADKAAAMGRGRPSEISK